MNGGPGAEKVLYRSVKKELSMKELTVAGIGPGDKMKRTLEVEKALEEAELIMGYTGYIAPLREEFPEKEFYESGMTHEIERCRKALEEAFSGRRVVLISSGDAGVYGMASPVLELAGDFPDVKIRVLPGVTAALSGAALLGAPLGHDFAVISLSDRLTPWEVIERRLRGAAGCGLPVVIYNPASRGRAGYLKKACRILLEVLPEETPCGMVRSIGRPGEEAEILTLRELAGREADMFTTVFIGDESTVRAGETLVTPRGYPVKEL